MDTWIGSSTRVVKIARGLSPWIEAYATGVPKCGNRTAGGSLSYDCVHKKEYKRIAWTGQPLMRVSVKPERALDRLGKPWRVVRDSQLLFCVYCSPVAGRFALDRRRGARRSTISEINSLPHERSQQNGDVRADVHPVVKQCAVDDISRRRTDLAYE